MDELVELMEAQIGTEKLISRMLPNFHKLPRTRRTAATARSRISSLKVHWDTFQKQHAQLHTMVAEETRRQHEYFKSDKLLSINDVVEETLDVLCEFLESVEPSRANARADASLRPYESPVAAIKLPSIDIPKFSGEVTKWEPFRDLFEALVSNRTDLNNVQKLHYLKANLTGEASLIFTKVTDANYDIAWALLKSRYDNPRAIVNAHLQAFIDIPSVSSQASDDLKNLRDKTSDIYTALLNLKRPVNQWEDLLIFMTVSKLDKFTRRDWEFSLGDSLELPNFAELDGFFNSRIRALDAMKTNKFSGKSETNKSNKSGTVKSHQASSKNIQCVACDGNHYVNQCKTFLNKSLDQRVEILKHNKCYLNCLRKGHLLQTCKSSNVCTLCKRKQHTLIHREKTIAILSSSNDANKQNAFVLSTGDIASANETEISSNNFISQSIGNTLLPTASVLLKGHSGRALRVGALLDQGSQASFVSESVAQLLKAERRSVSVDVSGIGGSHAGKAKYVASFTMEPISGEGPVLPLNALVLPKLTSYLPKPFVVNKASSFLNSLKLTHSEIERQERIELIIGADYYGSTLRNGVHHGSAGSPTAQLTIFGWVLSEPVRVSATNVTHSKITANHITTTDSLNDFLRKFWELEEVLHAPSLSGEEALYEAHFVKTHTRQSDGRYIVRLPFKTPPTPDIGETETDAKRIFFSTEARLVKQPDVANAYREFMNEYERLNHMEKIPKEEVYNKNAVYLPHQAVVKKQSQTTKVRVVLNASRISSNNTSLNDHLLIGPKLHADLFALILRWRTYRYVYSTDIAKMFRQILVHKSDTDFQRIFWRHESNLELYSYRLLTVTYGTALAPYLANRVLKQLASDERSRFPLAAPILENGVYVDDLMFGDDEIERLKQTREQLKQLLMAGGFQSHKWASNDSCLLTDIPASEHGLAECKSFGEDSKLKILGIVWSSTADAFKMHVQATTATSFTKRSFLSLLSRIFDPLGWVAPVTISAKVTMQMLWLSKVKWDEPLPVELADRCLTYQSQLTNLQKITIPRWTGEGRDTIKREIHGFSDASNSAYAAVVYLRIESTRSVQISLLYAKTRVAPIKVQSIPRLELCAAVLLVQAIE